MKNHKFSIILTVTSILLIACILAAKITHSHAGKNSVPAPLTHEQIMEQLQQELSQAKQVNTELQQMLSTTKANLISAGLATEVHTSWIVHQPNSVVTYNNKPILFGFRDDGFVVWKGQ